MTARRMADELFTRCPGCKTIFRVTEPQLALRGGPGAMRPLPHRVQRARGADRARRAGARRARPEDELAQGPPTVTLRSAHALDPPPPRTSRHAPPPAPPPASGADYENRFAWETKPRARRGSARRSRAHRHSAARRRARAAGGRSISATRSPRTCRRPKPALQRLCAVAGLRDPAAARRRGAVDRRVRPAGRPGAQGLLILTATLRNRARYPIGYPHLELTLTDAARPGRRAPRARAGRLRERHRQHRGGHCPPTARSRSSSSSTPARPSQAGYRLYLFFP